MRFCYKRARELAAFLLRDSRSLLVQPYATVRRERDERRRVANQQRGC